MGINESQIIQDIDLKKPHILLVGMGVPRQEKWIADVRDRVSPRIYWAVGALFDYVAGEETPVPAWMDALALEWLWRLLIDPRGKWRRYLVGIPKFLWRLLHQRLNP